MAKPTKSMTTTQFAEATGIPAATVTKLIREGKLKAKKEGRSWMIPPGQLEAQIVRNFKKGPTSSPSRKPSPPARSPQTSRAAAAVITAPASQPLAPAPAAVATHTPVPEPIPAPAVQDQPAEKTFTISEFATMTYLTEKGVAEWVKLGRLQGKQTENGEWVVSGSSLQEPDIVRLIRK